MAASLFKVEVDDRNLRVLVDVAKLNLNASQLTALGGSMRDLAARVQARAVRNVSGYPVQYDGRVFRVVTRTGALKGAIDMQWPYQSQLQSRVFINGAHTAGPFQMGDRLVKPRPVLDYAAAIEFGHGPIDLKPSLQGKTIPFFASRSANSTGPYSARGLTPVAGSSDLFENIGLSVKLGLAGKGPMQFQRRKTRAAYDGAKGGAGTYFIAFRKVGKTGWIIPAAKPRPFMRAALKQSERDARTLPAERLAQVMSDAAAHH